MQVVTAGIPEKDDCPILTRLQAYVADQGVCATLEHVFRDRAGNPVDLSDYFPGGSESGSASASAADQGAVELRAKEWLGTGWDDCRNPVWSVEGQAHDPAAGVVRAGLPASLVARPGIYELSWGVRDAAGGLVLVNQGILSVEKSLFGGAHDFRNAQGPPTLREMRMWMMDSSASENTLLDDVEFSDDQILLALTAPVRQWNESPPPIKTFTTRDFPFRGAWATGTLARLHEMAAAHYRRNYLRTEGGGVRVEDKAKEREYLAEAERLRQRYESWLINKKVSINMKLFSGYSESVYASLGGW